MAKLSAHGRTEIWRLAHQDGRKYALMSDGKLLKYTYHWTVAKIKERLTNEQVFTMLKAGGFVEVKR